MRLTRNDPYCGGKLGGHFATVLSGQGSEQTLVVVVVRGVAVAWCCVILPAWFWNCEMHTETMETEVNRKQQKVSLSPVHLVLVQ